MTRDEEIEILNTKLRAAVFRDYAPNWDPCRDPSSGFFVLGYFAADLEPSVRWDEASGGWLIQMEGAQAVYVPKQDLAFGICQAIVAAKRL